MQPAIAFPRPHTSSATRPAKATSSTRAAGEPAYPTSFRRAHYKRSRSADARRSTPPRLFSSRRIVTIQPRAAKLCALVNRFARTIFALSDLATSSICVTRSTSHSSDRSPQPLPRETTAGGGPPWLSSLALRAASRARCRHGCRSRSARRHLALWAEALCGGPA